MILLIVAVASAYVSFRERDKCVKRTCTTANYREVCYPILDFMRQLNDLIYVNYKRSFTYLQRSYCSCKLQSSYAKLKSNISRTLRRVIRRAQRYQVKSRSITKTPGIGVRAAVKTNIVVNKRYCTLIEWVPGWIGPIDSSCIVSQQWSLSKVDYPSYI